MCVDQEGCTRPDYKNDFGSKEDAVKRLIRFDISLTRRELKIICSSLTQISLFVRGSQRRA